MAEYSDFDYIWIFSGEGSWSPTAVFHTFEEADTWIRSHKLKGYLSEYPIGISVYDWAIQLGYFKPKHESQNNGWYIQKFGSGYLNHSHYTDSTYQVADNDTDAMDNLVDFRHIKDARQATINLNISTVLQLHLADSRYDVIAREMRVKLTSSETYYSPDILVIQPPEDFEFDRYKILTQPIVLIDIVSSDISSLDQSQTLHSVLGTSSVRDYVRVARDGYRVEHYSRQDSDEWAYRTLRLLDDEIYLSSIGFDMMLEVIYAGSDWSDIE